MSSTEHPPKDLHAEALSGRSTARSVFTPPRFGVFTPAAWGPPATQLTLVSMLAGAACFAYLTLLSPARLVFSLALPPVWAALIDLVFALWIAFAVRGRPGARITRLWPFLLMCLAIGLSAALAYDASEFGVRALTSPPAGSLCAAPWWQALTTSLFVALAPLWFRIFRFRVDSAWLDRMGVVSALLVALLALPLKWLDDWSIKRSSRIVNAEVTRLSELRDDIDALRTTQDTASLSKLSAKGAINTLSTWTAARTVNKASQLEAARQQVIAALVRARVDCPPPPVVPPPNLEIRRIREYLPDKPAETYLNNVEKARIDYDARAKSVSGYRAELQRLCDELRPPKGSPGAGAASACVIEPSAATCPELPPEAADGPPKKRPAISIRDAFGPSAPFAAQPEMNALLLWKLINLQRVTLESIGCYDVPPAEFKFILYCNLYTVRDKDGNRLRLQMWAAFRRGADQGEIPSQTFLTFSTAGSPGADLHRRVMERLQDVAAPSSPKVERSRCPDAEDVSARRPGDCFWMESTVLVKRTREAEIFGSNGPVVPIHTTRIGRL